jgi:hypothetical protein
MDFRKRQTPTATPAKPGELSSYQDTTQMVEELNFPEYSWKESRPRTALEVSIDFLPDQYKGRWLDVVRKFTADWVSRNSFKKKATLWMWGSLSVNFISRHPATQVPNWSEFIVQFGLPDRFLEHLARVLGRTFDDEAAITEVIEVRSDDGWAPICHVERNRAWRAADPDRWVPIDDGLSVAKREEIAGATGKSIDSDNSVLKTRTTVRGELATLSLHEFREFADGVSAKTEAVLLAIAKHGPRFKLRDVLTDVMKSGGYPIVPDEDVLRGFRGIKAGLTKRTRTILGDPEVELIWYQDTYDNDKNYVDTECCISKTTYRSMQSYFRRIGEIWW